MLSLWMLSLVLLGAVASPLTDQPNNLTEEDKTKIVQAAFDEKKNEVLEEVELRERALEEELLDTLLEEERLLDTELLTSTGDGAKFIADSNVEGEKFFECS